jgi:hypothetical protein
MDTTRGVTTANLRPTAKDEIPAPSDLDAVVEQLRRMKRNSKFILAIDVGRLVVERIYRGDREVLKRRGRDHAGFGKLAAHPQLPFSKTTLWRYVGVSELVSRMRWVVETDALTVAHLTAVFGLQPGEQQMVLRLAVERGWTAKELRREVEKLAPKSDTEEREPPPVMSVVRRLERIQKKAPELGHLRDLKSKDRERIQRVVEGTRAWCEAVECWLRVGVEEN